jgi:hypothetical protein
MKALHLTALLAIAATQPARAGHTRESFVAFLVDVASCKAKAPRYAEWCSLAGWDKATFAPLPAGPLVGIRADRIIPGTSDESRRLTRDDLEGPYLAYLAFDDDGKGGKTVRPGIAAPTGPDEDRAIKQGRTAIQTSIRRGTPLRAVPEALRSYVTSTIGFTYTLEKSERGWMWRPPNQPTSSSGGELRKVGKYWVLVAYDPTIHYVAGIFVEVGS